jgi:hypothetical protein
MQKLSKHQSNVLTVAGMLWMEPAPLNKCFRVGDSPVVNYEMTLYSEYAARKECRSTDKLLLNGCIRQVAT